VSAVESSPADQRLIESFLDALWMERGLSDNTLNAYRRDLSAFSRWLADKGKDLVGAGREDVLAYLALRVNAGARPRTTARLLSSLRRFFRHQLRQGAIATDPTALIDAPRLGRPLPHVLTEEQVETLLAAPDASIPRGLRDRAMLELLYACGLRVTELVGLRLEQIDLI
jgi:integrase/recombinase XerD